MESELRRVFGRFANRCRRHVFWHRLVQHDVVLLCSVEREYAEQSDTGRWDRQ